MLEKTVFFDFSRQFSQQCIWHIPSVHILVSAVYFSVFSLRMSWDWIFYCLHWLYTFFWHAQFESIWGEIRNIFCPNTSQLEWSLSKHGNWPKKSNAIAIEILTQKSNAIVIMQYFYEKSNAIVLSNCNRIIFPFFNVNFLFSFIFYHFER